MIKFEKPANLNGIELVQELNAQGIQVDDKPFVDANNDLWLAISKSDEQKAKDVVKSHNGTVIPSEPTVADKLASVGLKLEDLKSALGSNAQTM